MTISQIVLTAFVVQWIISQYKNEKSELQKELTQQFEKSQQEVLDTLIEKNLIAPLLKNKNGFKLSIREEIIDTFSHQGKLKMFINKTESNDTTELVTVVTDTIYGNSNSNISAQGDSSNNVLLHGVRLLVKEVSASPGQRQEFERRLYSGTDSSLLKKR